MTALDRDGDLAILRLEHGKASALDLELVRELVARIDEIERSDAAAVVVTGTGSIFSAGVDLKRVLDGGVTYLDEFLPALDDALERLYLLARPVVAACNGHAIAGGCVLVCACDLRIMATGNGRIGVPELLVGVPFPAWPLAIVRAAMAAGSADELILTGTTLRAERAVECGLVHQAVEPETLLTRACERAHALAAIPADAYRITKAQMRQPTLDFLAIHRQRIDRQVREFWRSDEALAAIRRFVERTLG